VTKEKFPYLQVHGHCFWTSSHQIYQSQPRTTGQHQELLPEIQKKRQKLTFTEHKGIFK